MFQDSKLVDYPEVEQKLLKEFEEADSYDPDKLDLREQILPSLFRSEYYETIARLGSGKQVFQRWNDPRVDVVENSQKILDTVNFIDGIDSRYGGNKNAVDLAEIASAWKTRDSYDYFLQQEGDSYPDVAELVQNGLDEYDPRIALIEKNSKTA